MSKLFDQTLFGWYSPQDMSVVSYTCGFCGDKVSSTKGLKLIEPARSIDQAGGIFLCPYCGGPTFFTPDREQIPSEPFGARVSSVPQELNALYEEARRCTSSNCFTAAVMLSRKILMHIAADQGAQPDLRFQQYVDYLSNQGFIPPNGKHWVDHIRRKGNEANHEIVLMGQDDAKDLLVFVEMLLKFIYEFPNRISQNP